MRSLRYQHLLLLINVQINQSIFSSYGPHSVNYFVSLGIFTVPLKSKLTLKAQNSRLNPRILNLKRFEFRDARIESWVSMIEDPKSQVFWKNNVVQSRTCSDNYLHRRSVLAVRCSVTVWIVGVRQAFNKRKSIFSFSKCGVMDARRRGNRITVC